VSRYRHKILLSIACFAVAGAVVPSAAAAHERDFPTTLTIKDKGAKFKGRVKSDSDDCTKKRLVILYGQEVGEDPMEVGRVRSDKKGKWKFQFVGDHYYAEVNEKVIERGDHKHTCLFDRSPTTPFPMRAHNEEFESTITIKEGPPGNYKGKVISDSDDCMKNRRVTLIAKESGSDAEFVIGHDRTDKKGRWHYQVLGDGYYAEVKEKVVKRGDHKHTCLYDRSPTTPFKR